MLFVHGISGYPREFAYLIDQLDRRRFQPWFYFYPSGAYLEDVAEHLRQTVIELRAQLGFERLFVVAHSMGGLVSREFALGYYENTGRRTIPLLVTIATPWVASCMAPISRELNSTDSRVTRLSLRISRLTV